LGDLGIDGRIVLFFNKYGVMLWAEFFWLGAGTSGEIFRSH
jgi:hypothetical protein